jgi:hypothetical protein
MEKEFIPYEQALALKELGFDEPCFGFRKEDGTFEFFATVDRDNTNSVFYYYPTAPLYQQAFRWFREKYDLTWEHQFDDSNISLYVGEITYPDNNLDFFKIIEVEYNGYNKAYEEAELECLKKLIEIVKENVDKQR